MRLEILVHHAGSRISYSYTALCILKVHFLVFLISASQTHEARQETWPFSAWQIRPKIQARFLQAKVLPVPQTPCGSWHELPSCQWRCWFKLSSYSSPLCHRQEPQSPHLIAYLVSLNQPDPRQHPLEDASSMLDSSYSGGASMPRFFLYSSNSNRSRESHSLCCV